MVSNAADNYVQADEGRRQPLVVSGFVEVVHHYYEVKLFLRSGLCGTPTAVG